MTSASGSLSVVGKANIVPTGVSTTSALGSPQLVTNNFLSVAGYTISSAAGAISPTAAADVSVAGFPLTIDLGITLVYGEIDTRQNANYNVISDSQIPTWTVIATS